MDYKKQLLEKYRKELGCKNIGHICWCNVCTSIESLINETVKEVKKKINNL